MKNLFFILMLFIVSQSAPAQVVYKGTIGTYPILFDVAHNQYCYLKTRKTIELTLIQTGNKLKFFVTAYNTNKRRDDTAEFFVLTKQPDKTLKGFWENRSGHTLAVALRPVDIATVVHQWIYVKDVQQQKEKEPLKYLRTADLKMIKDSITTRGKYKLDWFHLDISAVNIFHITAGLAPAVMKSVNRAMDDILLQETDNDFDCSTPNEGDYDFTISHLFITDHLLSFVYYTNYYCGGAHPSHLETAVNIDLKTGKKLRLEDIIYFGKTIPLDETSDEYREYREKTFAPKIMEILTSFYPKEMARQKNNDDCDYSESEYWKYASWRLDQKGLWLLPSLPYAFTPCSDPDWAVIPYSALAKYRPAGSTIALPK